MAEDRAHTHSRKRNRTASVQEVAEDKIGVVQIDPLARGVEGEGALVLVALARMTNCPGTTTWKTEGLVILAGGTVMEGTLASQDGAEAGDGEGDEVRMAQVGLSGSRDLQVKWTGPVVKVTEVVEAGEVLALVAGVRMTWIRWTVAPEDGRGMVVRPAGGAVEAQILPGEAGVVDLTVGEVGGDGVALENKAREVPSPKSGASEAATPKAGVREVVAEGTTIGRITIVARRALVALVRIAAGVVTTGADLETHHQEGAEGEVDLGQASNKKTSGSLMMAKVTTRHGDHLVTEAGVARKMMGQDGVVVASGVRDEVVDGASCLPQAVVGAEDVVVAGVEMIGHTLTMNQWTAVMARQDGTEGRERPFLALT